MYILHICPTYPTEKLARRGEYFVILVVYFSKFYSIRNMFEISLYILQWNHFLLKQIERLALP